MTESMTYSERRAQSRLAVESALKACAPNGMTVREMAAHTGRHYVALLSLMRRMCKSGQLHCVIRDHSGIFFANAADRDACRPDANLRKIAPLQIRVLEFVSTIRLGATQRQIRAALGINNDLCTATCVTMTVKTKRMYSIGPAMRKRYFPSMEALEAVKDEALADIEREAAAMRQVVIETRRQRDRDRYWAKIGDRKPKAKKIKVAVVKKAPVVKAAPVTIQKAAQMAQGPAIIPPHVKVQVIPGFTRGRFEVTEAPKLFALVGIGRDIETGRAWGQS